MNRQFLASVITCFMIASVGSILAQAPAQPAPAGKGTAKGGQRPGSPATPEDLADIAKLASLPAWVKGSGDGDYSTGPDYTAAPEETQRVGIPHGNLIECFMNSASSKVFPGVNGPFERLVPVYIPSQYFPGATAPFLVRATSYASTARHLAATPDDMQAAPGPARAPSAHRVPRSLPGLAKRRLGLWQERVCRRNASWENDAGGTGGVVAGHLARLVWLWLGRR